MTGNSNHRITPEAAEMSVISDVNISPEVVKPTIQARTAEYTDISRMVEIEKERYSFNYEINPRSDDELQELFEGRLEIAQDWMFVVEVDGNVEGFTSAMPTTSTLDEFESWEKTTNNGTLVGTYEPAGNNVYVVNLDVSRRGTKHDAQFKLMATLGEKVIAEGKDRVIFVSRMPDFAEYIEKKGAEHGFDWLQLDQESRDQMALEYYNSTVTNEDGRQVPRDRLLRFYQGDGFNLGRLVPNGFSDPESLDYGVLCTGENPLPERCRDIKLMRYMGSKAFKLLAQHPELISKVIR